MDVHPTAADPSCAVRSLTAADLDALVRIDRHLTGRTREEWYRRRLDRALADSDVRISLAAEVDGALAGALFGQVLYGEYGQVEPVAVIDTVLVDPARSGQGVGRAMLDQLLRNLRALRIERVRTEVAWDERGLMAFLQRAGFVPAPRLVLELEL